MQYFEVRECRRRKGEILREILIRSNAGGRDRARIFEFARMREESLANIRVYSNMGGRNLAGD